jgi:hypothetical protein
LPPGTLGNDNNVQRVASARGGDPVRCGRDVNDNHGVSMIDNSTTGTFQVNLPKDLLSEAKRSAKVKTEQLRVEGWRNSWLSRISELLVGKD